MESSPTLEEQLMEAGNKLLKPPSSIEELLPLLDEAVSFLKKVQQSPAKSVLASLSPLIKALVEDALLRNSNLDAKVALASCLSEITRITAPSVPYGDEKMRLLKSWLHFFCEMWSDESRQTNLDAGRCPLLKWSTSLFSPKLKMEMALLISSLHLLLPLPSLLYLASSYGMHPISPTELTTIFRAPYAYISCNTLNRYYKQQFFKKNFEI
ncbi:hypothetical protein DM860_008069 [Cuscuta australis]|uniref:Uncharacterized protein n=1 Tax=Cuscuta australis TaxID=267555 RepID=A0A328D6F8_9ASTE|nr:hypothetical protein DM860_008069 [Cuscuta australis]